MSEPVRRRRKKKKSGNGAYIIEIILCLITLSCITFLLLILVKYRDLEQRAGELQARVDMYENPEDPYLARSEADQMISSEKELSFNEGYGIGQQSLLENIKLGLLESNSTLETLKPYYPDELIVVNNNTFYFFPILDTIKHHEYASEDFSTADNGRITYSGPVSGTETWIDVSRFQEKINWDKVAADGIDGSIIRLGYRGYSKGDIMDDDTYVYNVKNSAASGLKTGVYFLTQATSDKEATEEADYVLDKIKGYKVDGPIVIDVELVGGDEGRGNALTIEERTQYVITFLERIKASGHDVMIYGNLKTFLLMLDMEKLEDYKKWFAGYTDTPYFPYAMDMWQYTDTGSVSGISGSVDINIFFTGNE